MRFPRPLPPTNFAGLPPRCEITCVSPRRERFPNSPSTFFSPVFFSAASFFPRTCLGVFPQAERLLHRLGPREFSTLPRHRPSARPAALSTAFYLLRGTLFPGKCQAPFFQSSIHNFALQPIDQLEPGFDDFQAGPDRPPSGSQINREICVRPLSSHADSSLSFKVFQGKGPVKLVVRCGKKLLSRLSSVENFGCCRLERRLFPAEIVEERL